MRTHEVFQPSPEKAAAINCVAVHDVMGAVYTELAEEGALSVYGLTKTLCERTGIDFQSVYGAIRGYPSKYVHGGFAHQGNDRTVARDSSYYVAINEELPLSFVGGFQAWTDTYHRPIFGVLSYSASTLTHQGPIRSLQILDGLLQGMQPSAMNLPGYAPTRNGYRTANNHRFQTMLSSGLIEAPPIEIRILNPRYEGRLKPFQNLKPESQAVYKTLRIAHDLEPAKTWTVAELNALAKKYRLVTNELKPAFDFALSLAISIRAPSNFPGVVEKQDVKAHKYRVAPDFQEAAASLLNLVKALDGGNRRVIQEAEEYAFETYRDPARFAKIVLDGIDASPYVRAHRTADSTAA